VVASVLCGYVLEAVVGGEGRDPDESEEAERSFLKESRLRAFFVVPERVKFELVVMFESNDIFEEDASSGWGAMTVESVRLRCS
jgi:hypothetical protein